MGELDDLIANADRDIQHGKRDGDVDRLAEGFSKALTVLAVVAQEIGRLKEDNKILRSDVDRIREPW